VFGRHLCDVMADRNSNEIELLIATHTEEGQPEPSFLAVHRTYLITQCRWRPLSQVREAPGGPSALDAAADTMMPEEEVARVLAGKFSPKLLSKFAISWALKKFSAREIQVLDSWGLQALHVKELRSYRPYLLNVANGVKQVVWDSVRATLTNGAVRDGHDGDAEGSA
jgi:hypothetical protein